MKKSVIVFLTMLLLIVISASPVLAQSQVPQMPHAFYGMVFINGNAAPYGTQVSATVSSGTLIATQNPVYTLDGSYGITSKHLLVQGNIPEGATIKFYVNGIEVSGVTAAFQSGGGPTQRNLYVTSGSSQPAAPTGANQVAADIMGSMMTWSLDEDGVLQNSVTAYSPSGGIVIDISTGTVMLDADSLPLDSFSVTEVYPLPEPPVEDGYVLAAFDFQPDGATFNPGIEIIISYDSSAIPEGMDENNLFIGIYNDETGEWQYLSGTVDAASNSITFTVTHFTTFSVLALPDNSPDITPESTPGLTPTITPTTEATSTTESETDSSTTPTATPTVTPKVYDADKNPPWLWIILGVLGAVGLVLYAVLFKRIVNNKKRGKGDNKEEDDGAF